MYTILRTYGRRVHESARIDQIDITNISFQTLTQHYYDVYFIIQTKGDERERVLYFSELPIQTQISDKYITDWIKALGNQALPLGDDLPMHLSGEVYSWDGLSRGFDYKSFKYGIHPRSRMLEEDKTDLLITHPDVDYNHATLHSLVSINGLFHYHEDSEYGWVCVDGNKTRNKRRDSTHVNILDFTQIGEVHRYRITDKMIRQVSTAMPLSDQFYIDTGVNLTGKTLGIVIGGYLHLLDNTYKQVSNTLVKVLWSNLMWETLYFKMNEILDLELPITKYSDNPSDTRVLDMELYHDEVIRAVLKHPTSFLVVIYNPCINIEYYPVGHMGIPKRYETAIPPIYPLRIGEGRYMAYHATKELDRWSLAVDDDIIHYPIRYQKPLHDALMIHDAYPPVQGQGYAPAHFVRITSDRDICTRLLDSYFENMNHNLGTLKPYMQRIDHESLPYVSHPFNDFFRPPLILNEDLNAAYYRTNQSLLPFEA